MRIDVKKFLFFGLKEEHDRFFRRSQEAGIIHFVEPSAKGKEVPAEIDHFLQALKILRGLPTLPQEELETPYLAQGVVQEVLALQHELLRLEEIERTTRLEIERVGIFGDFSLEECAWIEENGDRSIQFFFSKQRAYELSELPLEVIYIGTQHELDYFVSIAEKASQYPKLVEMRIEHPLGELLKQDREVKKELEEMGLRLKTYAKYHTFLHNALIHFLNHYELEKAKEGVAWPMEGTFFAVSGWVPMNKMKEMDQLVEKMGVRVEEVAIESTDRVPTYLENEGLPRIGEDLVHIYDTPSVKDKDPSLWVLGCFAFFFAFIVGDGGYGLIFLAAALYFRYKRPNLQGAKKRVLTLVILLACACIGWGVLTHSFFGIPFAPDGMIRKWSLLQWLIEKKAAFHISQHDDVYTYWVEKFPAAAQITDPAAFVRAAATPNENAFSYDLMNKFSDSIMFELALLVGIVHILIAMGRYLTRNWAFLGWMLVIVGCYLYFPHYLGVSSMLQYLGGIDRTQAGINGPYLIAGGTAIAIIIATVKNKLLGLTEVMVFIQVFADVMSYLRLYALGLSGSIISATLNEVVGVLPMAVAAVLLLVGHVVNMTLAVMGGIIHGLRLNFLEWYHYSFEGGGKAFKPLKKYN